MMIVITVIRLSRAADGSYGSLGIGPILYVLFGDSAPDGYLACDGAEYNKADYIALSAHLATLSTASQYAGSTSDNSRCVCGHAVGTSEPTLTVYDIVSEPS